MIKARGINTPTKWYLENTEQGRHERAENLNYVNTDAVVVDTAPYTGDGDDDSLDTEYDSNYIKERNKIYCEHCRFKLEKRVSRYYCKHCNIYFK